MVQQGVLDFSIFHWVIKYRPINHFYEPLIIDNHPKSEAKMPKLMIGDEDYRLRDVTTIGRKDDNDITINCAKISKKHATITRINGQYFIEDLKSSNGVRVNNQPITAKTLLKHNDVIQMGTITAYYKERRSSLNDTLKLVTINRNTATELYSIRAEIEQREEDFSRAEDIQDIETLKEDYEKLRLAYELSKESVTVDSRKHYLKMLDLMFTVLPIDRGVILELDYGTNELKPTIVKFRDGKGDEGQEINLSNTILDRVKESRKCLITADATEDPDLGKSMSIATGKIRSVMCVPLIAHDQVLGILHLDSKDRINAFAEKDVSLVQTIVNQTAIMIENSRLFKEFQKEVKVTEQLSRFLAPQLVQEMIHSNNPFDRGGVQKEGTILFADIRSFTALSEKLTPEEVFSLLNGFFERMVSIVFKHNGMVDKFIGDCLMCGFGLIEDAPFAELRAISAALDMQKAVVEYNELREEEGKQPISVGIGLNTGNVFFGCLGGAERVEVTSIGDAVNVSSRICGIAQENQVILFINLDFNCAVDI